jgi:hypothetical protein
VPLPLVCSRQVSSTATVDRGPSIVIAVQPTPSAKVMSHSSGGVIHLDESDADGEEVVGSDVEEVAKWDHKLRGTKTFSTGFLILSGRRFDSPNLDEHQKILFSFIDQPAHDYFLSRSQQARAFEELKIVCKR